MMRLLSLRGVVAKDSGLGAQTGRRGVAGPMLLEHLVENSAIGLRPHQRETDRKSINKVSKYANRTWPIS
jgi:hypothetical protein